MRLNRFLLLVILTCIACDSIVASSKGLIQVKTLDATSQRELTDGTRRKLRGSLKKNDIADVEERAILPESILVTFDSMVTKSKDVAKQINLKSESLVQKFKNFIAKLKRTKTGEKAETVPKLQDLEAPVNRDHTTTVNAPPRTNTRENTETIETVPKLQDSNTPTKTKYLDAHSHFDKLQKPKELENMPNLEIPTNPIPGLMGG
ncbi:unnamed protein product [Peronospora destructor]|uniref:RxLR effector protein n=1 Tax=Peronospora destructor TaxID=86335 RepID=A0AAV0UWY1_9STRA|nr:unnamed protein product [Peronospora destructor]